jgi:hypothetical protein
MSFSGGTQRSTPRAAASEQEEGEDEVKRFCSTLGDLPPPQISTTNRGKWKKAKGNGNRKAGGGIGSRVNVEKPVRVGDRAKVVNPRSVSQIGQSLGNKATDSGGKTVRNPTETFYGGREPAGGPGGVELGNSRALNVGGGGPGAGREVMRSGSQCTTGPVNPGVPNPGANKPIFPGFK